MRRSVCEAVGEALLRIAGHVNAGEVNVSDASAALIDAANEPHAHPVFGQLLHDFGHKRLYLGSPTTLWAGTLLWERQRAFRKERATLIAQAKGNSSARGWPWRFVDLGFR